MATAAWTVSSTTDRTGVRLDGPALPVARRGGIPSEGMVAGAVPLPPGGRPIVLMRNHPPTGGYPVVAVGVDSGVDALAQAPPGTMVSFRFRP
jgi:allophanate hydrolase subunit 2